MPILIADSGGTKTEWCLTSKDVTKNIRTEGLNPYYHTTESIKDVIESSLLTQLPNTNIDDIYFYGAGCDNRGKNNIAKKALEDCFPGAVVHIKHDLLAAARACFFTKPGIACILGTGSNSCLYDGSQIIEHIPSLAFILGDEGSAGYFGKKLINKYFRCELPDDLKKRLEENYNISLSHIMTGMYNSAHKNRFIASYSSFLGENDDHPFIKEILYEGFENFITRIVINYSNATDYEVRFIGSVAYAYQDVIREILEKHGMTAGLFMQNPMKRLVEYHTSKVY